MSMVVFAIGCGGGHRASTPPQRVGDVEVRAWPAASHEGPLQGSSTKPANLIITVGDPEEPAIAWITSDGTDLIAAYCVTPAQLVGAQARAARQRNPPIAGYIEMTIKPGVRTSICQTRHQGSSGPPVTPPPPTGPGPVEQTCAGSTDANCNYVILSPGKKGPAGQPPPPDKAIRLRFDLQLQRLGVFRQTHSLPGHAATPG